MATGTDDLDHPAVLNRGALRFQGRVVVAVAVTGLSDRAEKNVVTVLLVVVADNQCLALVIA